MDMNVDWDVLNDETFNSDMSDEETGLSWERGHFDFVNQQGTTNMTSSFNESVLKECYQHKNGNIGNNVSTPKRDIPGTKSNLSHEVPDSFINTMFSLDHNDEVESTYFEQSLAKSFDEMFTDDASNQNGGRVRNVSESELFPDSFKFSPPLPSFTVGEENIWNPEQQENDTDYINKHIKSLLNISTPDNTTSSTTSKNRSQISEQVFTLEELESGFEPQDVQSNQSSSQMAYNDSKSVNQPVALGPIGTPPNTTMNFLARQMSHPPFPPQNRDVFSSQPQAGMPVPHHHHQQMLNEANAFFEKNKVNFSNMPLSGFLPFQAAPVPPMGPFFPTHQKNTQMMSQSGLPNMPSNFINARQYPNNGSVSSQFSPRHQIPQGGRFHNNRGSNFQSNNSQRNNKFQNRNQMSDDKIVKGLMTQREVEWIFKVQLMQLKMEDVAVEDYYYQNWKKQNRKKNITKEPSVRKDKSKRNKDNSDQQEKSEETVSTEELTIADGCSSSKDNASSNEKTSASSNKTTQKELFSNNSEKRVVENATKSDENKVKPGAYEPTKFENTLGKLSVGSVFKPRKIIELDYVTREREAGEESLNFALTLRQSRKYREHLIFVEKSLTIFDELHKMEQKRLLLPEDDQSSLIANEKKILKSVLKYVDFNYIDEIVKNFLMCSAKGCRFLAEVLLRVISERQIVLMLSILNSLHILLKKEVQFKNYYLGEESLFAFSLGKSFNKAVDNLESNIDKVELMELLISNRNWRNSRFALSLFAILLESIVKTKDNDNFSYQRLLEMLSTIEEQTEPSVMPMRSQGDGKSVDRKEATGGIKMRKADAEVDDPTDYNKYSSNHNHSHTSSQVPKQNTEENKGGAGNISSRNDAVTRVPFQSSNNSNFYCFIDTISLRDLISSLNSCQRIDETNVETIPNFSHFIFKITSES